MKIYIADKHVDYFSDGTITLNLDSVASTFSFTARFLEDNVEHQVLFKPLQYLTVKIYNSSDKLIFTGTILNHTFSSDKGFQLITISGYSLSGILEDVTIAPSNYPLEINGKTLAEIANQLCAFYGIKVVVDPSAATATNTIITKTASGVTDSVKNYLSALTTQKNVLLSHNERGDVVLMKPDYLAKPKYFFNKENSLDMTMTYNGQGLHSDIYLVRQPSVDNAGAVTAGSRKNNLIDHKYRPTTTILNSGDDTSVTEAANMALKDELKAITGTVKLQGLFDEIKPGDIINIHNHRTYNFAYNRFMVQSIAMHFSPTEDTTDINYLLPEAFCDSAFVRNTIFNHVTYDKNLNEFLNEFEHPDPDNYKLNPFYNGNEDPIKNKW